MQGMRQSWQNHLGQTKTILYEKAREALASVLPITAIVLVLCFTISPIPPDTLLTFLVGAVLLIFGMALFTLGAETAMTPIGERVGAHITRKAPTPIATAPTRTALGTLGTCSARTCRSGSDTVTITPIKKLMVMTTHSFLDLVI